MPRFAANISRMFSDRPFLDRFDAAAEAGFWAVESLFPYAWNISDLRERLEANGLTQVLINSPAGVWKHGERGLAALPDRRAEFRDGIHMALDYAAEIGCNRIHLLAGRVPEGESRERYWWTYLDNLSWTASQVQGTGVEIMLEPINNRDVPGYLLSSTSYALEALESVQSHCLYLQYDLYHALRMAEQPEDVLRRHLKRIRHIHVAGMAVQGAANEIPAFDRLFTLLDQLDYDGWVGRAA
ncbi:hydroxypyruvate isomerase family protein [Magnetospira sp. QH-2]|uniref:hydroxypyruvate isomerase family protein n=1 Tax=Magnetospira sp. (strain QH-2) TaxID=1288970 RepID=UPI0003E819AE|nr:TIM barrel protein [Magnetospira sp. QH-2]CCQ74290.1 Hydroxypyruvate isomerase [Magnetospira sp. QH-2]